MFTSFSFFLQADADYDVISLDWCDAVPSLISAQPLTTSMRYVLVFCFLVCVSVGDRTMDPEEARRRVQGKVALQGWRLSLTVCSGDVLFLSPPLIPLFHSSTLSMTQAT